MKPCCPSSPHELCFFYRASNPWAAKNSGSQKPCDDPCQSEALRRTSLSTITWGQGVPEKRVFFPFPVAVPLPLFLMPAVHCLFVEPRARRLKSIFNGQNGGGQKLRQPHADRMGCSTCLQLAAVPAHKFPEIAPDLDRQRFTKVETELN